LYCCYSCRRHRAQGISTLNIDQSDLLRKSALEELCVAHEDVLVDLQGALGNGASGIVYEGRYSELPVAVKIVYLPGRSAAKRRTVQKVSAKVNKLLYKL